MSMPLLDCLDNQDPLEMGDAYVVRDVGTSLNTSHASSGGSGPVGKS